MAQNRQKDWEIKRKKDKESFDRYQDDLGTFLRGLDGLLKDFFAMQKQAETGKDTLYDFLSFQHIEFQPDENEINNTSCEAIQKETVEALNKRANAISEIYRRLSQSPELRETAVKLVEKCLYLFPTGGNIANKNKYDNYLKLKQKQDLLSRIENEVDNHGEKIAASIKYTMINKAARWYFPKPEAEKFFKDCCEVYGYTEEEDDWDGKDEEEKTGGGASSKEEGAGGSGSGKEDAEEDGGSADPPPPAKNRILAGWLAIFFGTLRVHEFYLGNIDNDNVWSASIGAEMLLFHLLFFKKVIAGFAMINTPWLPSELYRYKFVESLENWVKIIQKSLILLGILGGYPYLFLYPFIQGIMLLSRKGDYAKHGSNYNFENDGRSTNQWIAIPTIFLIVISFLIFQNWDSGFDFAAMWQFISDYALLFWDWFKPQDLGRAYP
ncbi:MAG: TM2 domain-containing protein [Syntrophomonadaceae bacterium]|nr:TM2 domain-containing protein [Syntrophomonadaceae bacterium]